ncbi:MAG TPA: cupin domain-containing protein [Anaerolineales bacterium]
MRPEVKALIDHYHFMPLPAEGTLFLSTYRSATELDGGKPFGTAIIAMYTDDPPSISRFHRLPVDEVWHFYSGDPMRLILLYPDGTARDILMGSDPLQDQQVQFVIPAGVWQAGHMLEGGRYSLFGCTMAPGFTDEMFEGGTLDLLRSYPERAADIRRFACDADQTNMPEGFAR